MRIIPNYLFISIDQELEELLGEIETKGSAELSWTQFKAIARKLHLVRVPETSLLAAVLMFEIGLWCVVLVTLLPYHFCCVGPAELWDRTDGFLGYMFAFLMEGVHYPAIRRQMYFFPAMVFLIGGAPYLLFKVPLLGPALFGLRSATGYDKQGNVRVTITAEESEHRYKHEQRAVSKKGPGLGRA